jgi:transglutaminase-like putative cysteine protease
MVLAARILLLLTLLVPARAAGPEPVTRRVWLAGQESGTTTERETRDAGGILLETRERTRLERMGVTVAFEVVQKAHRRPDGSITCDWRVVMSQEPQEGRASWSPAEPDRLRLTFKDGPARTLQVPPGALLWPGDLDDRLRAAARSRTPVTARYFAFPTQQWSDLDLQPVGPAPLPGFPDTVRFKGRSREGAMVEDLELWLSPTQGEVKHMGTMAGVPVLSQRAELPPPGGPPPADGLFKRSVKALPPHPFLLWLPEATVRWTGRSAPALPEDAQQQRLGPGRYRLARALPPTPAEAAELPVRGAPDPADAPYLAATPLVQFRDPVFAGLERRLAAPAGAGRWDLARRVNRFVFEWIRDKNYSVGFASAQEVARNPEGACAQHGMLAIALLRRLGVPARAATGWIGLGDQEVVHFWVEARIGGRWIPLDPTFDQAPASAFRIKLNVSDVADLGSVGAAAPGTNYLEGAWTPEGPWAGEVRPQGDSVGAPGGLWLRLPGSRWQVKAGRLTLAWDGAHRVEAAPRPAEAQLAGARRLQGSAGGRQGWFEPRVGLLWMDLGGGRWLQVDGLDEGQAFRLLDALDLIEPKAADRAA